MAKMIVVFILMIVVLGIKVYPQEGYSRDPFLPLIPMEAGEEIDGEGGIKVTLPPLKLEGVLWGGNFAQVIIDGQVYKVGDSLKDIEAKVFRIEKNTVFISFKNKIYELTTNKVKKEENK